MRGLRSMVQNMGLATKQFIFLTIVFSGLFYALAWGILRDAESVVRDQGVGDAQVILDRTNRLLDSYIDTIMSMLLLVRGSQTLLLEGDDYESRKALYDYSTASTIVRTLYFIREDGRMLSSRQGLAEALGNPELERMYRGLRSPSNALTWSEPYYSPVSGNTVAFVLPATDKSGRVTGTAVAEIDLDLLKTRLHEMIGNKDQTFAVLTSSRRFVSIDLMSPLLPFVIESYQKKLDPAFAGQLTSLATGVNVLQGAEHPLIAVQSASNRLNWSIVAMYDEQYFYKNIHTLNDKFRRTALLWMVILFVSVWIITRLITKPIRKLALKMDRVHDFEIVQPIRLESKDEIGLLAQSYNKLLLRVKSLIKEIKEAEASKKHYEYRMLQSQIGPHFLYNTLTCISSLAKQQKYELVRETIRSLGGLLHYSFQQTSPYVTLEQELEGLRMYVQIQKMRYDDMFDVTFEVAPELLRCTVLKLTLQPLVENAVFHGIAPKSEPGLIRVLARKEKGLLKLYVIDDGVGIAPDYRRTLLHHRPSEHDAKSFNSIGLTNVHERIKLHFGEEFGLKIASRPGVGTVVRMSLPRGEAD